jgi:hypothetical protein
VAAQAPPVKSLLAGGWRASREAGTLIRTTLAQVDARLAQATASGRSLPMAVPSFARILESLRRAAPSLSCEFHKIIRT